ncbi:hypothetical protein AMJ40_04195 [candidate division TA06 bacterium DG_26]|uniref:Uncharacterized protein n=1 Tax=candidate division TA06 bacterium DG_26 TaxID=1703771 RepID=A0A0S7WIV2_UNCT6|nr:MAG: hypothetical protein AMJ40_04195 [candidate division TA06 bacterium DG_26]
MEIASTWRSFRCILGIAQFHVNEQPPFKVCTNRDRADPGNLTNRTEWSILEMEEVFVQAAH